MMIHFIFPFQSILSSNFWSLFFCLQIVIAASRWRSPPTTAASSPTMKWKPTIASSVWPLDRWRNSKWRNQRSKTGATRCVGRASRDPRRAGRTAQRNALNSTNTFPSSLSSAPRPSGNGRSKCGKTLWTPRRKRGGMSCTTCCGWNFRYGKVEKKFLLFTNSAGFTLTSVWFFLFFFSLFLNVFADWFLFLNWS